MQGSAAAPAALVDSAAEDCLLWDLEKLDSSPLCPKHRQKDENAAVPSGRRRPPSETLDSSPRVPFCQIGSEMAASPGDLKIVITGSDFA